MKLIKIGLSLLIVNSLFAADIVDTTHKKVVGSLDNNVESLPKSMQGIAKDTVNVLDKDGKNLNFVLKLTNVSHQTNFFNDNGIDADPTINNYLLATAGVMFLPNTWKIELSYTGQIGKNVFYESKSRSGSDITSYSLDEGESDIQYINFYTKPFNSKFGDFGFGYTSMEQSETMMAGGLKIVDLAAAPTGNARYTTKNEYFYLTYNIPGNNKFYSGFGITYTSGTSNQSAISSDGANVVIKPDADFTQIDIGINKTLDEVNQGLSFRTLTFGTRTSDATYFNYDNSTNESYSRDYSAMNIDLIYMFKPKKGKKIYTSLKLGMNEGTYEEYEEMTFELGVIF